MSTIITTIVTDKGEIPDIRANPQWYVLRRVINCPDTVGLLVSVDSNNQSAHDLPALYRVLDQVGLEYVVNRAPLKHWDGKRSCWDNLRDVIHINVGAGKVAHILLRTIESWKPLRAVNIGWAVVFEKIPLTIPSEEWLLNLQDRLRCPYCKKTEIIWGGRHE